MKIKRKQFVFIIFISREFRKRCIIAESLPEFGWFGVVSTIWDGYFASDHFPVVADIILN